MGALPRLLILSSTLLPLLASASPDLAPPFFSPRYVLSDVARRQIEVLANRSRRIDIPKQWRQRNWVAWNGSGSCVWASTVTLLRWQGHPELAERIRARYAGGATPQSLAQGLDREGVSYAATYNGDERFLEWCIRTRRGACVRVNGGPHMINLVGLDDQTAELLDNNDPQKTYRISRAAFLQDWKTSFGSGWAFSPVYDPHPPAPWILKLSKEK